MDGQECMKFLGEDKAASRIEKAVMKVIAKDMKSQYAGQMGITTSEVGDRVAAYASE